MAEQDNGMPDWFMIFCIALVIGTMILAGSALDTRLDRLEEQFEAHTSQEAVK